MVKFGSPHDSKIHNMCPFTNISFFNDCRFQSLNSKIDHSNCKLKRFEYNKLNQSNFDKEGNLIANTKFKKQYSFEINRSINSSILPIK